MPSPHPVPVELRFWDKVDKNGPEFNGQPCWLWKASKSHGYGKIGVGRTSAYAHRVAYEMLVGPIPAGLHIDHLCRVRACVNPDHLEPVSLQENLRRGVGPELSRQRRLAITHCKHGHPFDEANTRVAANGWRICRACRRALQAKRGAK